MEQQVAKLIFDYVRNIMKFTLDLEETKFEKGREDSRFKFFKKVLMKETYENLETLFQQLKDLGLVNNTSYPEDVKNGWKDSASGGSGYLNTPELDDFLTDIASDDQ